ncbi:hypothetical protein PsYK624_067180 [Phanerochaete sordida]|uniref:DUF6534 domain-containing protein n=1 Tax=Phanerochaete sordida TaxID=48140 RepID=A0A9P3G9T2_9APHY|nr:hypothetical protein PsYK624_067180 [Phanerochaete sordida]
MPESTVVLNVMSTYGVELIAAVFSTAFWGISCAQVFFYFLSYENDHWAIRFLVIFLWSLDTVVEAVTWSAFFPPLITQWGYLPSLLDVSALTIHRTWLASIMAFCAQIFFLFRIYRFTGGRRWTVHVVLAIAGVLAVWQIVGIIVYCAWVLSDIQLISVTLALHRVVALSITNRATTAATDILITVWMTYLLATQRSRTQFGPSNRMLLRLMWLSINSGMWTAVFALTDFSLIAWRSTNLAFTLCELPLASLYLNMVLANLNARRYVRDRARTHVLELGSGATDDSARAAEPIALRRMLARSATLAKPEESLGVRVDTDVMQKGDGEPYGAGEDDADM